MESMSKIVSELFEPLLLVGQVHTANVVEMDFTTTTASKVLKQSAPTVRRKLNELVDQGLLIKLRGANRGLQIRYVYRVSAEGLDYLDRNKVDYHLLLSAFYTKLLLS
jgi:DNA-binding PadR family transcriptional regulator